MTEPGIKPVDLAELSKTKPSFVDWYVKQERTLLQAATDLGLTNLELVAFHDKPVGSWKYKKLLRSNNEPVARYWLSLRRPHKSTTLRVPRFNLETSTELADKFRELSLKKDVQESKIKEV